MLACSLVLGLPIDVSAYRTLAETLGVDGRVVWPASEVVLRPSWEQLPDGVSASEFEAALRRAAARWSDIECATVELRVAPAGSVPASGDGVSTVAFTDRWEVEPSAAAFTELAYETRALGTEEAGARIVEADLILNARDVTWGIDVASSGVRDLETVLTHELGHVLGLLHPCEVDHEGLACGREHRDRTMHPVYFGLDQRQLAPDDRAGLCYLYPRTLYCNPACATGERCVEGHCEARASCDRASDCASGGCEDGACVPIGPEAGDPCASHGDCATGVCATEGICTASCESGCPEHWACGTTGFCAPSRVAHGEPCSAGRQCMSELCVFRDGAEGRCSRACGEGCPAGEDCEVIEGTEACVPNGWSEQGCSASGRSGLEGLSFALLGLLLVRRQTFRRRR